MAVSKEVADNVWNNIKNNIFILYCINYRPNLDGIYKWSSLFDYIYDTKCSFYRFCNRDDVFEADICEFISENFQIDNSQVKKFD